MHTRHIFGDYICLWQSPSRSTGRFEGFCQPEIATLIGRILILTGFRNYFAVAEGASTYRQQQTRTDQWRQVCATQYSVVITQSSAWDLSPTAHHVPYLQATFSRINPKTSTRLHRLKTNTACAERSLLCNEQQTRLGHLYQYSIMDIMGRRRAHWHALTYCWGCAFEGRSCGPKSQPDLGPRHSRFTLCCARRRGPNPSNCWSTAVPVYNNSRSLHYSSGLGRILVRGGSVCDNA